MEASTKKSAGTPVIRGILRLFLYAFGVLSIFRFFFSFLGVLIGVLFFAFIHDRRRRAHGIVLGLSAALSEFVAPTSTALEPIDLALRTGPAILAVYLLAYL